MVSWPGGLASVQPTAVFVVATVAMFILKP